MKKIIPVLSVIALVAVVVIVLISNKRSVEKKTELATQVSTSVSVGTEVVKASALNMSFSSNGSLEPIRELSFVSDVSGRVMKILAEEGSYVSAGQVLIQSDKELLEADFTASEAAYNALKVDLERFTNANKTGGVTDQQLESIRTQYVSAESRYITSRRRLADSKIKAPISGVISKRYIEIGSYLNPGAKLFDIIDDSKLRVWCNVTEHQVLLIKKGQNVRVRCNTFPEETYNGIINFIGPRADKSLNFPVEVIIEGKEMKLLKAGMYVTAYFDALGERQTIVIPRSAITGSVRNAKVYLVKNGTVKEQDVVVGSMMDKKVEILNGLQAGDSIVVAGLINVSEGVKVTAR
jgi:membrane fusion protein, multidrug efflux system